AGAQERSREEGGRAARGTAEDAGGAGAPETSSQRAHVVTPLPALGGVAPAVTRSRFVASGLLCFEQVDPARRRIIHDALVRLSDGDRTAVDSLLEELWPVIRAFAERGLGHAAEAEDVAQEVFLRICSRISDFDRERDGVSWAFGIAAYQVLTHRRRIE